MIETFVRNTVRAAESVRLLELGPADGIPLPGFGAGDHIDVTLAPGLTRSYSLVGTPERDPSSYRIAVALDPESRGGSRAVHESVHTGSRLVISEPAGGFRLMESAPHSVLIAGGIGITPILSMARRLTQLEAPWEVHYAARSRHAAAFLPELSALADSGAGGLRTYFADEDGPRSLKIASLVADTSGEPHLYCCGPASMLADFEEATRGLGPDRVHLERFRGDLPPAVDGGFTVELARSGKALGIAPGATILDAVLDAGVDVDFSCMEGICGSCRTRVLAGEPEHRDTVLSAEERAAGDTMMICCSGTKGTRLVLDL
ncbi:2Fe-2S iron-sulfur cluster-binding protein [Streptomyces sp. RPA4-2]|uniref:PDR/VanB family oxidoreductase n=1 Tax=Streptomyces sp. RPA4-2 TaxID=2721244 RepID=UPI00143E7B6B|nr:PDR/VanB family oxidoreductase [Streptomyces sp. RPA4-2]QIY61388.1 oxidoreductase [Streptomyces sp. RPA4-2]